MNSAIVGGEQVDYYIDESHRNAEHLEQAAKAHIGGTWYGSRCFVDQLELFHEK